MAHRQTPEEWRYSTDPGEDIQRSVIQHVLKENKDAIENRIKTVQGSFPKRRRAKVICPITGEETSNVFGISNAGWNFVSRGLFSIRNEVAFAQDKTRYKVEDDYGRFGKYDWDRRQYPVELVEFAAKMSQQAPIHSRHDSHDVPMMHPKTRLSDRTSYKYLYLTQEQANALLELVSNIQSVIDKAYQEGYRAGSGFLTRMAEGSVTIDEINQAHTKRETDK